MTGRRIAPENVENRETDTQITTTESNTRLPWVLVMTQHQIKTQPQTLAQSRTAYLPPAACFARHDPSCLPLAPLPPLPLRLPAFDSDARVCTCLLAALSEGGPLGPPAPLHPAVEDDGTCLDCPPAPSVAGWPQRPSLESWRPTRARLGRRLSLVLAAEWASASAIKDLSGRSALIPDERRERGRGRLTWRWTGSG